MLSFALAGGQGGRRFIVGALQGKEGEAQELSRAESAVSKAVELHPQDRGAGWKCCPAMYNIQAKTRGVQQRGEAVACLKAGCQVFSQTWVVVH